MCHALSVEVRAPGVSLMSAVCSCKSQCKGLYIHPKTLESCWSEPGRTISRSHGSRRLSNLTRLELTFLKCCWKVAKNASRISRGRRLCARKPDHCPCDTISTVMEFAGPSKSKHVVALSWFAGKGRVARRCWWPNPFGWTVEAS